MLNAEVCKQATWRISVDIRGPNAELSALENDLTPYARRVYLKDHWRIYWRDKEHLVFELRNILWDEGAEEGIRDILGKLTANVRFMDDERD